MNIPENWPEDILQMQIDAENSAYYARKDYSDGQYANAVFYQEEAAYYSMRVRLLLDIAD